MGNLKIKELENVLLDQIEALSDMSINEKPEEAQQMIERSQAISNLTNAYIGVQRVKLDVVKEVNRGGSLYETYLGIESDLPKGK